MTALLLGASVPISGRNEETFYKRGPRAFWVLCRLGHEKQGGLGAFGIIAFSISFNKSCGITTVCFTKEFWYDLQMAPLSLCDVYSKITAQETKQFTHLTCRSSAKCQVNSLNGISLSSLNFLLFLWVP